VTSLLVIYFAKTAATTIKIYRQAEKRATNTNTIMQQAQKKLQTRTRYVPYPL